MASDRRRGASCDVLPRPLTARWRWERIAGLPLHRFPLERAAAAHAAVESGVVGKVLIDVA